MESLKSSPFFMHINKFYNKSGKISSRTISNISDEDKYNIIKLTEFLENSPTISQRIRVIKENITEHPICSCGKYVVYNKNVGNIFRDNCGNISCAKKGKINKKFDQSIKLKKEKIILEYEHAAILPLEDTINFFVNNINKFKNGGSVGINFLNNNLEYKKSLYYYTSDISDKLNHKIYELINGKSKCKLCSNTTAFISLEKGYREYCNEHGNSGASINKGLNNVEKAIKSINKFTEFKILSTPYKINDAFILQHSCRTEFNLNIKNGKLNENLKIYCPKCHLKSISKPEYEIYDWLSDLNINSIQQYKLPDTTKSLDIFIPEFNLGIEYHGLLYHSFGKHTSSKFDNYLLETNTKHTEKLDICIKNNIRLLQIFSNEWTENKDIWKSLILSKLGKFESKIYARKCIIKELTQTECDIFLNRTHLQGSINSKYRYGLFYEDRLVSCLLINKPRMSKKYDWEILRFSSELNLQVIGGFSKLLAHFRKNHIGSVISYANRRWSVGDVYIKNKFRLETISKPNYFYFKNNTLESRHKYQKHKLKNVLLEFNPNNSESINMYDNGFRKIYDAGNLIFYLE